VCNSRIRFQWDYWLLSIIELSMRTGKAIMFQVFFILLATMAGYCVGSEVSNFREEKQATRVLFDSDRNTLNSVLALCKHSSESQNTQECRRAEYVARVDEQLAKLRSGHVHHLQPGESAVPKVRDIDESYQSIFENYVVKHTPFKGKMSMNKTTVAAMSEAVSACAMLQQDAPTSPHPVTGDFPLEKCSNILDLKAVVQVPALAANSYNARVPSPFSGAGAERDAGAVDLASHWPSLLHLTEPLALAGPRACPLGMHMILWSPSVHVSARIFSLDLHAYMLSPSPGVEELHHVQFRAPSEAEAGVAAEASLAAGSDEYLFVPRGYLVSVAQREDSPALATVCQMCFFDASNVNFVRESLSISELVLDPQARRVTSLLQPSGGETTFDFNMTRQLPDGFISYNEYAEYPRRREEGAATRVGSDEPSSGGNSKPRRGRDRSSKGGASSFRGRQACMCFPCRGRLE
jgi:hypothetical protein